jgi:transcriptional regulator with XRE-family HTH domain
MGLGEKMQALRRQNGLSQAALAKMAGLPVRSIQNWEQGHRTPSAKALLDLARVLKVPVESLISELPGQREEAKPKPRRRGRPRKKEK